MAAAARRVIAEALPLEQRSPSKSLSHDAKALKAL